MESFFEQAETISAVSEVSFPSIKFAIWQDNQQSPGIQSFIHSSRHVACTQDSYCHHFYARKFVPPDNLQLGWLLQGEPRPVHVNLHGFAKPQRNDG